MLQNKVVTIASGATISGEVGVNRARSVKVEVPATLTGTITLQVSFDNSSFKDLHSDGSAVTLSADAVHVIYSIDGVRKVRLVSSAAEGAEREFRVVATA